MDFSQKGGDERCCIHRLYFKHFPLTASTVAVVSGGGVPGGILRIPFMSCDKKPGQSMRKALTTVIEVPRCSVVFLQIS